MDSFDSAIALIGDEYRDDADAAVLDREARHTRCAHAGPPVTERICDPNRAVTTLRCTVARCFRSQEFADEILGPMVEREARRIALERSRLAQTMRRQQIVEGVRSEAPSAAPTPELVAEAKQALADRDPDAALRAVVKATDPRRS